MPLHILMIAPQPFFRARGTPFSVLHRIRALLQLGHRVDLITYPFGEHIPLDGLDIIRSSKPPLINDVKIGPSFSKMVLDVPLYFKAKKQLRMKSYDIIHSHEEAAFFAAGLARRYRIPHVYDMHSSLPQQLQNFQVFNFSLLRKVFERLERYVLESCDGIITICEDLAKTVESTGVSVPHSMIENTADDTKVFPPADVDVVQKHSLDGKKIVLYTGTFEAYQGLDTLLAAFKIVANEKSDAHLLLVGGRNEQIEGMRLMAEGLDIRDAVSFSGTVPSSEIPSYLKAADVIASPRSSGTNTPLKIYGYMKSGVPIVATDKYTHTQTLDAATAHLVPPTPEGLAFGIIRLLDDPQYGESLARAARSKADAQFSDSAYIARVEDFYAKLIPSGGPSTDDNSGGYAQPSYRTR